MISEHGERSGDRCRSGPSSHAKSKTPCGEHGRSRGRPRRSAVGPLRSSHLPVRHRVHGRVPRGRAPPRGPSPTRPPRRGPRPSTLSNRNSCLSARASHRSGVPPDPTHTLPAHPTVTPCCCFYWFGYESPYTRLSRLGATLRVSRPHPAPGPGPRDRGLTCTRGPTDRERYPPPHRTAHAQSAMPPLGMYRAKVVLTRLL